LPGKITRLSYHQKINHQNRGEMDLVVFGASGRLGLNIVEQALTAGHRVTAFVRSPSKLAIQHSHLTLFQGDSMNTEAVYKALADQEAVISALGPARPLEPGMMETSAKNIVAAMKERNIYRLVSTTGAGVWQMQDQPKSIDYFMAILLHIFAREVERDSFANVDAIKASDLDWTVVRFPRLTDGPRTGRYRVGYIDKESSVRFSRADAAEFILKELIEKKWVRKAPLVSY
jgi:putative NADH-flavin reductase